MLSVFVDADDLWNRSQIEKLLVPLLMEVPTFRITCYAIPNRLGPVHDLKKEFPWITFAQHGWEHTPFECRVWTQDSAERYIEQAHDMGYAPIFKAPNWVIDEELVKACVVRGVILHHHPDEDLRRYKILPTLYPGPKEWRSKAHEHSNFHTHVQRNPVTDFIAEHPAFQPERLKQVNEFLTIEDVAI